VAARPSVLFVCLHNAGRSQIAAAFLTQLTGGAVEVRSAGPEPADTVKPEVVAAMAEVGIDIAAAKPKLLTTETVQASDVVITMGCGEACPYYPGKRLRTGRWTVQPARALRPYGRCGTRSGAESRRYGANWRRPRGAVFRSGGHAVSDRCVYAAILEAWAYANFAARPVLLANGSHATFVP
jgi:protein-tyrosine-phosphatase